MTGCDTLLMIGLGFPYLEFLPKEGAASGVQIDLKPDMLSLRYPMEINLTQLSHYCAFSDMRLAEFHGFATRLSICGAKTARPWR